jgi:hypothetical protein
MPACLQPTSQQDLSNDLWALASLGLTPDPAWLEKHLWEVARRQQQKQLLPQHYANLAHALAKLGHRCVCLCDMLVLHCMPATDLVACADACPSACRPERTWAVQYQADVLSLLPQFKPQELSCVLWAMAQLNVKAEEVRVCARSSKRGGLHCTNSVAHATCAREPAPFPPSCVAPCPVLSCMRVCHDRRSCWSRPWLTCLPAC